MLTRPDSRALWNCSDEFSLSFSHDHTVQSSFR
jgi:hypothetical protein